MSILLARRAQHMNPSVIRELLKLTEQPGIISLAGGLPSAKTFPIEAMREAADRVLREDGAAALQYAASEGHGPLREWVAAELSGQGMRVSPGQVLITSGSQQGLDLVGKVLIDEGSRVLVESPTYLGALQAFAPMMPQFQGLASDDEGLRADALREHAAQARMLYLLPNFQNPTGRLMGAARRAQVTEALADTGVPLIEDNPYGDLWFDAPPPSPLSAQLPEQSIYLGSFSKVLAPGLRLGYVVAPASVYPKLLQAKQAADLHTPTFNQRVVSEVLQNGFLQRHVPGIRALYKAQCAAMLAALDTHGQGLGLQWARPQGGMFVWLRLPAGMDAAALLPQAVARGVAYVPGAAFFADAAEANTLRLSFVTASAADIERGIAALAQTVKAALAAQGAAA
ncbi:MAG: 2-aminoadipate transaminase [Pseudomonadota bacterium]|jgi:2-aminoadipate transaminase